MPDQMFLIITVRKPVTDVTEGKTIYELVQDRLTDKPELKVSGHVSNHFDLDGD